MEGDGVTNYDTTKSTYAITGATTEFDEALIQRGVVTRQQAIIAKGATEEQANRIVQQQQQQQDAVAAASKQQQQQSAITNRAENDYENDDDSFVDSDEDEFFAQYRKQRLQELKGGQEEQKKKKSRPYFGEVIPISRAEWQREVNEASVDKKSYDSATVVGCWVVVCLTSSDVQRTGCMEAAIQNVARTYPHVKFCFIPSTSAIPNWPMENLPSLFLYRHGKMQQELVRLPTNLSTEDLEEILRPLGVFSIDDDDTNSQK